MAKSNRDRIGAMFEVMAPALDAFIQGQVGPGIKPGQSWTSLVAARDAGKGITGKEYAALDPSVQLRLLTENIPHQLKPGWYPFDGALSRVHQSYASELRDVRNSWAHNGTFSDDDAYRALDTAERLMSAINAADAATQIARIRLDLRRVSAERDDARTLRQAASDNPEAVGLRPWRDVLHPHRDVASGTFLASEFAADLFKVSQGEGGRDYADPVEFFRRTYLTDGLRDLLARAVRRLAGDDNAAPVINLQTNFGGGKTHSMLSLWHIAGSTPLTAYPQEIQELLAVNGFQELQGTPVRRVAIVGNHFAASGEAKPDGTFVRTIWGELAWQLGGAEGYAIVADADASSTPPGAALHRLLEAHAPAVILIDEWVAYARALYGADPSDPASKITGGTFDNQFTFAQSLTEAAKGTPGIVLAISIPASESGDANTPVVGTADEVGGNHGLEALKRLQNVVRRVAEPWRPASSTEAYHIVRQRLFAEPDARALAAIGATARAFAEMYRHSPDDFPRESRESDYEERIKHTYPIHPELFDRLYEGWSSLERFQRTRGVLRLMNAVIHALWAGEDASPLIMPGSLPLATSAVNREIAQYLHDNWKAVIDTDVDGPQSEPTRIDAGRRQFGARSLTKRLARTVFFGAVPTIGSAHKGLETQRVFLGTAIPGDRTGDFHAALNALADRATYFYAGQGKYWYDLQANITRSAKDQADRLHPEDVWAEIARRLSALSDGRNSRGAFAAVQVCPEDHADIPDLDEARLVILHPKVAHTRRAVSKQDSAAAAFARDALEHRGSANRAHRNMLVFLAADQDRLEELDRAVRDYLGWSYVLSSSDLDLTDNQKAQATDKRATADQTVASRLLNTYVWALHPTQPDPRAPYVITETKADGQGSSPAERVTKRFDTDGNLAVMHAMGSIRLAIDKVPAVWKDGHVSVGQLWAYYADYPYMPRLRDQSVLMLGLAPDKATMAWMIDGFALAQGFDETTGRYRSLTLPSDDRRIDMTDGTLIVRPDVAQKQRDQELAAAGSPSSAGAGEGQGSGDGGGGWHPTPSPGRDGGSEVVGPRPTSPQGPARPTRFFGVKELDPDSYARDFKRITDEIMVHLGATSGVRLRVSLEIEAETEDGFDESKVRVVGENARTLKFEQSGFESH